jgi:hypothetical protein
MFSSSQWYEIIIFSHIMWCLNSLSVALPCVRCTCQENGWHMTKQENLLSYVLVILSCPTASPVSIPLLNSPFAFLHPGHPDWMLVVNYVQNLWKEITYFHNVVHLHPVAHRYFTFTCWFRLCVASMFSTLVIRFFKLLKHYMFLPQSAIFRC